MNKKSVDADKCPVELDEIEALDNKASELMAKMRISLNEIKGSLAEADKHIEDVIRKSIKKTTATLKEIKENSGCKCKTCKCK